MATFKKTLSGDSRYSITLEVTETSYSTADNTSDISYSLKATKSSGSGYYTNNTNNSVKVKINGSYAVNTTKKYDFTGSTPKTITLASGTVTGILHNDDGTKTIACSGYFGDANNSLGSATASGNLTLTSIPRESTFTTDEDSYSTEDNVNITITRNVNTYKHTLKYTLDGNTTSIFTNQNILSYEWPIPPSFLNSITSNPPTKNIILTLYTYDGDTEIGSSQKTISVTVPTNIYKPGVSISTPTEADATMISKNWGVFVQNKSKLSYTITNTKSHNANIISTTSTADGKSYSGTSVTTSVLTNSGTGTISASSTDTRGAVGTENKTYSVVAYSNPSITFSSAQRCLLNGTLDANGTYIKYSFKASVSSVSGHNSGTYKLCYKTTSASTYTEVTLGTGTSINITDVVSGFTISTDNEYDIKFTVTDAFTTIPETKRLESGFDLMNFNASGKSMAIGKVSQATASESKLEIGLNTTFDANITMASGKTITGNLTGSVNGNANTATTLATFSYSRNNATNTWCKVATTQLAGTWGEKHAILFIKGTHNTNYNQNGIIAIDVVGGGTAGAVSSYAARFFSCTPDLDASNFYIEYKNGNADTPATINFWLKMASAYAGWHVKLLQNVGWTIAQSTPTTTTMPSSGFTGKNSEKYSYAARSWGDKNGSDITTTYQKAPVQLYNNTSGTSTTLALSETSANFVYIEFFFKTNDGEYASTKVYGPNGKTVSLTCTHDNGTYTYIKTALVTISGTSVTFSRNTQARIGNNVATTHSEGTYISIVRIIGYK